MSIMKEHISENFQISQIKFITELLNNLDGLEENILYEEIMELSSCAQTLNRR